MSTSADILETTFYSSLIESLSAVSSSPTECDPRTSQGEPSLPLSIPYMCSPDRMILFRCFDWLPLTLSNSPPDRPSDAEDRYKNYFMVSLRNRRTRRSIRIGENLLTRNASIISCFGTASRCNITLASRIPRMIRGSRAGIVKNMTKFGGQEKKKRWCSLLLLQLIENWATVNEGRVFLMVYVKYLVVWLSLKIRRFPHTVTTFLSG